MSVRSKRWLVCNGSQLGRAGLLLFTMLAGTSCGDRDSSDGPPEAIAPSVSWDRGALEIRTAEDTFAVEVEIADTDERRAYGLMHRDALPDDAGMIFLYEDTQPAEGSFWMFNTRIPLDIAFIDAGGRIVSIVQMEPCTSPYPQWCPSYPAGAPYNSALEMNLGWFDEQGVSVGDEVVLSR